jgi:hypothetical protein
VFLVSLAKFTMILMVIHHHSNYTCFLKTIIASCNILPLSVCCCCCLQGNSNICWFFGVS